MFVFFHQIFGLQTLIYTVRKLDSFSFSFFFLIKFLADHMSFLGATGTPVLDFW